VSGSAEPASVRLLGAAILEKVDSRKAYADALLDQVLKAESLNERDRALPTEVV